MAFHGDVSGIEGRVGFKIIERVDGTHAQATSFPSRPARATARSDEASNALRDARATVALAHWYQRGLVVA